MMRRFDIGSSRKQFKTHEQLDRFIFELENKAESPYLWLEDTYYRQTHALLKYFDRCFWLRHFRQKEDGRWAPSMSSSKAEVEGSSCNTGEKNCSNDSSHSGASRSRHQIHEHVACPFGKLDGNSLNIQAFFLKKT